MRLPALLIAFLVAACACAQQATLTVATRVVQPFVTQDGSRLTGFSIDLWKAIGDKLNAKTAYVIAPTVDDLLKTVKDGQAQLGISAVSVTADRDRSFDFSQPMFESGLQILVPTHGQAAGWFSTIWQHLLTAGILYWLAAILVGSFIPAHLVWLVERRKNECLLRHKSYYPGVFEAYWWSLACLATQAEEFPKTGLGRAIAVFWMFVAVVFVALFTAQITASLTVQQLQATINGPGDLPGHKVATTVGSTSAEYLRSQGDSFETFQSIDGAFQALDKGEVDAVVFDAPVLQYYAAHEGQGKAQVVGETFRKENYGIVFPPGSSLRKPVDEALLALREDGTYQEIYDKWFGGAH